MRRWIRGPAWPIAFAAALWSLSFAGCEDASKPTSPAKSDAAPTAQKSAADSGGDASKPTASADLKRIIILENGNSPFWDAARAGLQDAENELKLRQAGMRAVLEVNDSAAAG